MEKSSSTARRQFRFRTMKNGRPFAQTLNHLTGEWTRYSFETAKDLVKRGFADDVAAGRPLSEVWAYQANAEYGNQS